MNIRQTCCDCFAVLLTHAKFAAAVDGLYALTECLVIVALTQYINIFNCSSMGPQLTREDLFL